MSMDVYPVDEFGRDAWDREFMRRDPAGWLEREASRARSSAFDQEQLILQSKRQGMLAELSMEKVWARAAKRGAAMQRTMLIKSAKLLGRQDIADWIETHAPLDFGITEEP